MEAQRVRPVAVLDRAQEIGRLHDVREEERLHHRLLDREEICKPFGVAQRAEALVSSCGGLELPDRALLVSVEPRSVPEGLTRAGDVVGRSRRFPERPGLPEAAVGAGGVPARELDVSSRKGSRGLERGRVVRVGRLDELVDIPLGLVQLVRGHRDLDGCGQEPGSRRDPERVVAECAADRGEGTLDVSLAEPEERKAWLWLLPVLVSLAKRRLCLRKLAQAQARLAELVEGSPCDSRAPQAELLSRSACLFAGLCELALVAHHLGPVHPA